MRKRNANNVNDQRASEKKDVPNQDGQNQRGVRQLFGSETEDSLWILEFGALGDSANIVRTPVKIELP